MALTRFEHVARIGSSDTGPEVRLRFHRRARRHRLRQTTSVGRPDLAFIGNRVVVLVDGCWHGCPIHYVVPRVRPSFWASELVGNVEREQRQTLRLEEEGWAVARVWEHKIQELGRVGNES